MSVYIHIYLYMLIIVYMYARTFYLYTYIRGGAGRTAAGAVRNRSYTSIHMCIYVYINDGMYACTFTCKHICGVESDARQLELPEIVDIHVSIHSCMYIYIYISWYVCMYIYIYTYIGGGVGRTAAGAARNHGSFGRRRCNSNMCTVAAGMRGFR